MDTSPFLGTEARSVGRHTRRTLRSQCEKVYRDVYVPRGRTLTAADRAKAAWLWSGRDATVAGVSAAALLGSKWVDPSSPAELIRPVPCDVEGIVIHRDTLDSGEACLVRGIQVTTPARTGFDLGRRDSLTRAVIRLDALASATDVKPQEISALVDCHRGARGVVQLRRAVDLMDGGAESPQETRTRLLLMAAGFPRPKTQMIVCDEYGYFIGRIDMGWPEWHVGVEYDGPQHWAGPADHARDIERIADLEAQGWIIIRVTRDILRYRPGVFLARVQAAAREAGWPHHASVDLSARVAP